MAVYFIQDGGPITWLSVLSDESGQYPYASVIGERFMLESVPGNRLYKLDALRWIVENDRVAKGLAPNVDASPSSEIH